MTRAIYGCHVIARCELRAGVYQIAAPMGRVGDGRAASPLFRPVHAQPRPSPHDIPGVITVSLDFARGLS